MAPVKRSFIMNWRCETSTEVCSRNRNVKILWVVWWFYGKGEQSFGVWTVLEKPGLVRTQALSVSLKSELQAWASFTFPKGSCQHLADPDGDGSKCRWVCGPRKSAWGTFPCAAAHDPRTPALWTCPLCWPVSGMHWNEFLDKLQDHEVTFLYSWFWSRIFLMLTHIQLGL